MGSLTDEFVRDWWLHGFFRRYYFCLAGFIVVAGKWLLSSVRLLMFLAEQLDGRLFGGSSEAEREQHTKGNEENDAGISPAGAASTVLATNRTT